MSEFKANRFAETIERGQRSTHPPQRPAPRSRSAMPRGRCRKPLGNPV